MIDLIEQYIESNHFGAFVGMDFKILNPGETLYEIEIKNQHLATPNMAHGGLISALLDASMGVGALSLVAVNNQVVSTVEMKVNFLRAVRLGDKLSATSIVVRKGKNTIVMQSEARNQDDKLVAVSSGTFFILPAAISGF